MRIKSKIQFHCFIFTFLSSIVIAAGCKNNPDPFMKYPTKQLTNTPVGHTIHNTQVFSKDDQWIVYDTRNDGTKIGETGSIEMVNTETGKIKILYRTQNQTAYGPGVGAATFSPVQDTVLFIHGIRNANKEHPYGFTRRTGVAVDVHHPEVPIFMDARDIIPPFTPGALRGGTHAHTWSGDGQWISCTYNDEVMEQLSKTDTAVKDLRTIVVMFPHPVQVNDPDSSPENNSGQLFSVVAAEVTEQPEPGSDEIDRAYDETWIGKDGYLKTDGSKQKRAIAFQGEVRDESGHKKTEVFITDLPDDLTKARPGKPLEGTRDTKSNPPAGVHTRRITHLKAGIEGPRYWLRTTPDGSLIAFLQKDSSGIVQIYGISPNGGAIRQITQNPTPVQGPFNFSPDGKEIAYPTDNSIFLTNIKTGETQQITPRFPKEEHINDAPVWSNKGDKIAYSKYTLTDDGRYFLQIYLITLKK